MNWSTSGLEWKYIQVSQTTGLVSQATGMELEYVKVSQAMKVEFEYLSLRGWNRFSTEPQMFGGFTSLRKAHLVQPGSLGDQMAIL